MVVKELDFRGYLHLTWFNKKEKLKETLIYSYDADKILDLYGDNEKKKDILKEVLDENKS
jgi:hypothetical protein